MIRAQKKRDHECRNKKKRHTLDRKTNDLHSVSLSQKNWARTFEGHIKSACFFLLSFIFYLSFFLSKDTFQKYFFQKYFNSCQFI